MFGLAVMLNISSSTTQRTFTNVEPASPRYEQDVDASRLYRLDIVEEVQVATRAQSFPPVYLFFWSHIRMCNCYAHVSPRSYVTVLYVPPHVAAEGLFVLLLAEFTFLNPLLGLSGGHSATDTHIC